MSNTLRARFQTPAHLSAILREAEGIVKSVLKSSR